MAKKQQMKTLSVRIPASLHKKIKGLCLTEDVTIQEFVKDSLDRYILNRQYLAQKMAEIEIE